MPKISVIIPVYNVEKYIHKCVDSILAQTYKDFELILVDDGSPDNCPQICDDYAKRDKRVHVIHKDNSGLSAARNTGLNWVHNNSVSEFVTFVDSDDYCEEDWLECLYCTQQSTGADLILSGYITVDETDAVIKRIERKAGKWELKNELQIVDYLIHNVLYTGNGWTVWTSLFKKEIIVSNQLEFCTDNHNFAEDMGFMLEYILFAQKIIAISDCKYKYVNHKGSLMDVSKNIAMLDSMNIIAIHFANRYFEIIKQKKNKSKYAIIYYLIMWNQYQKMTLVGEECKKVCYVDNQIQNIEWHDHWMKQLIHHRKELISRFGKRNAQIMILYSRLMSYRNWNRYLLESYLAWKFFIK